MKRWILPLAVLALALSPISLLAAAEEEAYSPPAIEPHLPGWAIVFSLVFLLCIAAVGFKNAKRTHLD